MVPQVEPRRQTTTSGNVLFKYELDGACATDGSCIETGVTAADVARLVSWTYTAGILEASRPTGESVAKTPLPDPTNAETQLRYLGIIGGCEAEVDDGQLVTRAEVLDLVASWITGEGRVACIPESDPDL